MPTWKTCCSCISQRWIFTILASLGLCIQSLFAVIMSITIIEMVVQTENSNHQQDHEGCESYNTNVSSINTTLSVYHDEKNTTIARYSWDEYTQGIILSSFSWSNTIANFIYGSLAERIGGKHLLGFGILAQALLTFITPFVINYWGSSTALIITRVLLGLGSDGMYPVISVMLSNWTTSKDRTLIGNTIYSGPVIALCTGTIVPALIIKYSTMGWPAVFYFFGTVGLIWYPFWLLLVYETPEDHPFISDREIEYLKKDSETPKEKCKLPGTPWKHIFTCKEFWAFTTIYAGSNWIYYLMLSDLPKYMGGVVKFSLENNAYFSAMPYFLMWINSMASAWINDKILEKKWMTLTNVRKLFATLSTAGPGVFLVLASYAECDKTMVVVMFVIGITLIGNFYSSAMMNPLDMSPNYAGSIMSATCGISSIASILAPYLVGVLAPNFTLMEWRLVFWIAFLCAVVSNSIYLIFFKAEIQPWNDPNFGKMESKISSADEEVEDMI